MKKKLEEVARFTPNPGAVIDFYERFLGSKPTWKSDDAAEFEVGGVKIFVHRKMSSKVPC